MTTHQENLDRVARLRAELATAEEQVAEYNELTDEQKLAEEIHARTCTWNHTDGCTWFYEKNWTDWTHARYLARAQRILPNHDLDDAMDFLKLMYEPIN